MHASRDRPSPWTTWACIERQSDLKRSSFDRFLASDFRSLSYVCTTLARTPSRHCSAASQSCYNGTKFIFFTKCEHLFKCTCMICFGEVSRVFWVWKDHHQCSCNQILTGRCIVDGIEHQDTPFSRPPIDPIEKLVAYILCFRPRYQGAIVTLGLFSCNYKCILSYLKRFNKFEIFIERFILGCHPYRFPQSHVIHVIHTLPQKDLQMVAMNLILNFHTQIRKVLGSSSENIVAIRNRAWCSL